MSRDLGLRIVSSNTMADRTHDRRGTGFVHSFMTCQQSRRVVITGR